MWNKNNWSVNTLIKMIDKKLIILSDDVPKWSKEKQIDYVTALESKFPSQSIYLKKEKTGHFSILDGFERLTAIYNHKNYFDKNHNFMFLSTQIDINTIVKYNEEDIKLYLKRLKK